MTAHFKVVPVLLPHQGIIPGARGHKKITIPRGTKVFAIQHIVRYFHTVYLSETEANTVRESLEDTVEGRTKRQIPLRTMLEWNFKLAIPTHVCRPKTEKQDDSAPRTEMIMGG